MTVDDIAAAADVSPRTFSNYFSSKESAVLATATDLSVLIGTELADRPDDEPLWTSLRAAVLTALTDPSEPDRSWVTELRLVSGTPALLNYQLATMARVESHITSEVARRTETRPDTDVYPSLVAATVTALTRSATARWLAAGSSNLGDVINEAFDLLATGLVTSPARPRHTPISTS